MDLYKKLKQKIADEFIDETDDEAGAGVSTTFDDVTDDGGSGSQEVLELRQEVRTLKAHIQNNYNVYVKRLDKRKARIKDLEEYAKLIVKDNETLTKQLQDSESKFPIFLKSLTWHIRHDPICEKKVPLGFCHDLCRLNNNK